MASIHIDDQAYPAAPDRNLLEVCLSLGFDLPYFCWHPAMGSVGACRQCAVKQYRDENDSDGKIVMACMTPAADGTRISIEDAEARRFRASVIEWLMLNHPHDCPVCEEGGECHLQDMTVMTGHNYRRYRGRKRTFRNQDLGPFINHEMNRCITCYRCVRFYQDYAGGDDLRALAAHNHVYFGRHTDGTLENEFSGNLVEVCPTGVFTDRTFGERYTRKWDLQTAPSICVHCGLGCNTSPGERYGELRRITNRYNGAVNGYFLCDRGRFGYGFVNSDQRILQPQLREQREATAAPCTHAEAVRAAIGVSAESGARTVRIGIGSPRASLEANFALRSLVGPERFYLGLSAAEDRLLDTVLAILREGPARTPSLRQIEQADAVLVLGEDPTATAPRLALALRQSVRRRHMEIADDLGIPRWQDASVREAAQHQRSPLFIASSDATRLDDVAARTWRGAPEDLARLGMAVAHEIDAAAPAVRGLPDELVALTREIAAALKEAHRPLVVAGTACASEAVLHAAANTAASLSRQRGEAADLVLSVGECNSLGLKLMGGRPLAEAFDMVGDGKSAEDHTEDHAEEHTEEHIGATGVDVVVLENDLYRRADAQKVYNLLSAARRVVALDHLENTTTRHADVVLPAGTFAESDGTLVSSEGRAQRFFQVHVAPGEVQESWRWLRDLALAAGVPDCAWNGLDELTAACAQALPALAGIPDAAPTAGFRFAGMRVSRAPHRYSGRTAMHADLSVHEHKPPVDADAPFNFSMEGYYGRALPAALIPYAWSPAWNSVQALNKFQDEVGGPLRGGDPGVRLLEPTCDPQRGRFFTEVPDAFVPRENEWRVVPLHHIFGDEELSARSPAIAGRTPAPYAALNPDEAQRLGLQAGDTVSLTVAGTHLELPLRLRAQLPRGTLGLPVALPALAALPAQGWTRIAAGGKPGGKQ